MTAGPEPDNFQKLVRWLVLIFFFYVCVHSYLQRSAPPAPEPLQKAENTSPSVDCDKKKKFPLASINFFPLFVPTVHNEDTKLGDGEPAFCGQRVKFAYQYVAQNKIVDKGEKTITLGGGTVPHGVELALIGMKPGGVRRVLIPPQFAATYNKTTSSPLPTDQGFSAKLSLLEASPAAPTSPLGLHVINGDPGENTQVSCGDKVTADITIWKLDGTVFYSSPKDKPVTFTVGSSEVPFGIEQAAISVSDGSSRTVILPPGALSKPLVKRADDTIGPLPPLPDEITVVQLDNVSIVGLKSKTPTLEQIKTLIQHKDDITPESLATPTAAPETTPDASGAATPSPHP